MFRCRAGAEALGPCAALTSEAPAGRIGDLTVEAAPAYRRGSDISRLWTLFRYFLGALWVSFRTSRQTLRFIVAQPRLLLRSAICGAHRAHDAWGRTGYGRTLAVRPGLTGMPQVYNPDDEPYLKLHYDLLYIEKNEPLARLQADASVRPQYAPGETGPVYRQARQRGPTVTL